MQVTPNEVGDSIYEFMNGFAVMWLLTSYYITGLLHMTANPFINS
jgi:hypothetical protein